MKTVLVGSAAALAAAAAGAGLLRYQEPLWALWAQWRYPVPVDSAAGPLGRQILDERKLQRENKVKYEYQKIRAKLAAASAQGGDMRRLMKTLDDAKAIGDAGDTEEALKFMNLIEARLPITAGEKDGALAGKGPFMPDDIDVEPPKPPARKPAARPARRGRARR